MRDIRGDLKDRADLLEEQINTAQAQFEKLIEQFKSEHDKRTEDLTVELDALKTLMGVEDRRLGRAASAPNGQSQPQPQQPKSQQQQPRQPHQSLADFLVRKLSEVGAVSRADLCRLAVQEGYFADGDSASVACTRLLCTS
jgi:peptidoglycan hydrolase CwlO-like protein